MKRVALALLASALAASCADLQQPTALPFDGSASAQGGVQLEDVIVVFNDDVVDPGGLARGLVDANGGTLGHVYVSALRGFSASLPPQAVQALQNNPDVAQVELDGVVTATDVQAGAPWGLDRVDQRTGALDNMYTYNYDGTGVTVYILDTGIRTTHSDFGGRASLGPDFVDDVSSEDCNGHGTHVAGTVGSATYGVAKNVNLVALRVLGCNGLGNFSDVIAAIDYVNLETVPLRVVNMSLTGPVYQFLNNAVDNSVALGVVHVVAAGNDNISACNRSPASAIDALTTGATTDSNTRSSFSNFGSCVDVFAPGSDIESTHFTSDIATSFKSGTSMASPHVAGVAALYLHENPGANAADVNAAIVEYATPDAVANTGPGSPNLLLHSLFDGDPPPPPTPTTIDVVVGSHNVIASPAGRNKMRGTSTIKIVAAATPTDGVPDVTVSGQWSGDYNGSGSGPTDANGNLTLKTPNIRHGSEFTFCINGLSGSGINNETSVGNCASSGGGPPPDPPDPPGPPTGLNVVWKTKGKARADLSWTGGASTVHILRDDDFLRTVSNNGSFRDNSPGDSYQVCNFVNPSPEECTFVVSRP